MPMERSVSCAERGSMYGVGGAGVDVRSYSASYARPQQPTVQRARSVSAWARPAPPPAVQRTASTKSSVGGTARPTPGINLRSYSASFAASYGPTLQVVGAGAGGGQGQLKRSGSVTNWTSANRRSVNLRGYTPSFAALDDTAAAVPAPARKVVQGDAEAELQRRKRLVVYKTYDVEGRVRQSVRRSVSWIKGKCPGILF